MAEKTSVVTSERFAAGYTYQDYIAQINVNKERFEGYYGTAQISAEDTRFFRKAAQAPKGAARMLVIGEDWCPDVFRGMPVMARIAEASGMEMRVFPRDANLDIMNEFLNRGEFLSIPVAVFYTKDQQYLCHWIERPASADKERAQIEAIIKKEMPNATEQELRAATRERTTARYPSWQQDSVREMRQMLAISLGI
ncbi:MAG: thioredoxin family protein [Dehalococcoidia bacterium]|nr:thioredoxin family protein [Dehalococcoidia bacterium]